MVQRVPCHFIGRTGDEFGNRYSIALTDHPVAFPDNAGFENQTVFKCPPPLIENGDRAVGNSFKQAEINRIGHTMRMVGGNFESRNTIRSPVENPTCRGCFCQHQPQSDFISQESVVKFTRSSILIWLDSQ